ncbi:HEPN domain-containing protein [bacterium]|nr:HEPN domain-containing protein [bacterium]
MTGEVPELLAKARESLAAAGLLRQGGFHAFAVSRAYYSMFYVAEALLASLGQSYSSHGGVLSAFGREFAKTGRMDPKFHRWLIDAQDFRNIGDYDIGAAVTPAQSGEVCAWARDFIDGAESYLRTQQS